MGNYVLTVLFLNTLFCALLMCPTAIVDLVRGNTIFDGTLHAHLLILLKSFIVLSSWILGYFSSKHLPLTIEKRHQHAAAAYHRYYRNHGVVAR